jgi:hypothetical protein
MAGWLCPSRRAILPAFSQGTEMPTAEWWEALWPYPYYYLSYLAYAYPPFGWQLEGSVYRNPMPVGVLKQH